MSTHRIKRWAAVGAALAATAAAAAGIATAGSPTTDSGGNFAVLDVDVMPPQASTKTVHRGIGIALHYYAGNELDGSRSPYNGDVTIRLPRGLVAHPSAFPDKCPLPATPSEVGKESRCPAKSKIGDGGAEFDARPAIEQPIPGTVTAYNGEPHGTRPTMIVMGSATVGQTKLRAELDLEYSSDPTGPYGRKLSTIHPVQDSTFGFASIRKLDLFVPNQAVKKTVKGKPVRIHLVDAPRKCDRVWTFELTIATKAGDANIGAVDEVGCVRA
jgi:hypothetical protein